MKSTIGNDIHVLQLQKWIFRTQPMQNNGNGYLTATRTQKHSVYDNALLC